MPYLNDNYIFINDSLIDKLSNQLKIFSNDIVGIILSKIYIKSGPLTTFCVSPKDYKEYFDEDFEYENEDEVMYLEIHYDTIGCRSWEYNVSWRTDDDSGRIESINSSSYFALKACDWVQEDDY